MTLAPGSVVSEVAEEVFGEFSSTIADAT